jgi:hypothetical protein
LYLPCLWRFTGTRPDQRQRVSQLTREPVTPLRSRVTKHTAQHDVGIQH